MQVLSLARLKKTFSYFPQILKQSLFIFLVLQAINFFFNQIMIYLQEARMTSKEDFFVPLIILLAILGFFVQTAVKVVWILVVCRFFEKSEDLSTYLRKHMEQGLIESLRSFLKTVLFGFLLLIPGIIKLIRYQFVVFVVALEDSYDQGHRDALKTSESLAQGKTITLLLLLLGFALLGLLTTNNKLILQAPITALASEAAALCLTTLECAYFYLLYKDLKSHKGLPA